MEAGHRHLRPTRRTPGNGVGWAGRQVPAPALVGQHLNGCRAHRAVAAGWSPTATEIVTAVIRLGQALGLTTIAEGVEDIAQFTLLRELGCDQAQGYLARPSGRGPARAARGSGVPG